MVFSYAIFWPASSSPNSAFLLHLLIELCTFYAGMPSNPGIGPNWQKKMYLYEYIGAYT